MSDSNRFSRQEFEERLVQFDAAWHESLTTGRLSPAIEQFLPAVDLATEENYGRANLLVELVMIDMECRWRRAGKNSSEDGRTIDHANREARLPERPRLSDYVCRYPELGVVDTLPARLIADEYRVRQRWGDRPGRQTYLDQYGDRGESLCEALDAVHAILQSPSADQSNLTDAPTVNEQVGQTIGPYKLMEQIGEGGMGVVYVAEQREPVKRRVALKVIKPGMDSKDVLSRFGAERQALAMMDHPNIARVLDAGAADSGQPFFVMELVRGVPITEFCDKNKLSTKERLQLFVDVCHAIQHAHHKGVVHRDIKPGNVLVTSQDGKPLVKVIDFGVAKAIYQRLTEDTIYTRFSQMLGTPLYMSPEQAEMTAEDVDTRSDIYSLGVLLYELLTGTPTIDKHRFQKAAYDEMRRIIREEEPSKPSDKVSTLSDAASSVSIDRGTDQRKLSQLLRGDLDWIVMKALEKERDRRYETANGFAMDIGRYLGGEAVEAAPPSVSYRLRKFVRRNKGPVIAASLILIVLISGIAGTTWGLRIALNEAAEKEKARQAEAHRAEGERLAKLDAEAANELLIAAQEEIRKTNSELGQSNDQLVSAQKDLQKTNTSLSDALKDVRAKEQLASTRLYAARINAAQQSWDADDGMSAWHQLNLCRGDLRNWEHRYLVAKFSHGHLTLNGHADGVKSVAFSPDGKRIVSSSQGDFSNDWSRMKFPRQRDHSIKVWDAATGQELLTINGHTSGVFSVAFSPDGALIVSGSNDKTVRGWNAETGAEMFVLKGHTERVDSVAYSPDGKRIISGSIDKTIKVWDVATGQELLTLKGHSAAVYSVAYSPDGKRIATGGRDTTIKIWNAETGSEIRTIIGHTNWVTCLAFSPDGKQVASGGMDTTGRVWDVSTGEELLVIKKHTGSVEGIVFSPDGTRLISGSSDSSVTVWDVGTGKELFTLNGHTDHVNDVAISPDGSRIASGGTDRTCKVWGAEAEPKSLTLTGHTNRVRGIAFSPDGSQIVSGSADGTLKIWDAANGEKSGTLVGHTGDVFSVAFSPDGQKIASGARDQTVRVWDVATGQHLLTLNGHTHSVMTVAFSPDGKRIASGGYDKMVKVWDAATGQQLISLSGHTGNLLSVAFSPDGKRIVSGAEELKIRVWDTTTGQEVLTLDGHARAVASVVYSPDGQRIVSGSMDNTVKIWDAIVGREIHTFKGHSRAVFGVAISPDGRRIVSGSLDKTVRVWDIAGQEVITLNGISDRVFCVAFSPDGRRVASGSGAMVESEGSENAINVWEAAKGHEGITISGHTGSVCAVALSPGGKRIVSAGQDRAIRGWDAATGEQLFMLSGHTATVTCIAFSPDGQKVVSGSRDKTIKVWDTAWQKEVLTLNRQASIVTSVAISPDGKRIVSSGTEKTVRVWDMSTGQELLTLNGHSSFVFAVAFSPSGKRIVSGGQDKTIRVWNAKTGQQLLTLSGHTSSVASVAFSSDGKRIVSGSADKTIKVWDVDRAREVLTLNGHFSSVFSVAFTPDDKRIVSSGHDGQLKVWDANRGQELLTLNGHLGSVFSVAITSDGKRMVSGSLDKMVKVWDLTAETVRARERKHSVDSPGHSVQLPKWGGDVLVAKGAAWKFNDDGKVLSNAWSQLAFDDASWPEGRAVLGYGEGDEATTLSFGPDPTDKHVTTYFRHAFDVPDAEAVKDMLLELIYDDGVAVYLNGHEVVRDNLPRELNGESFALEYRNGAAESRWHSFLIETRHLQDGRNVLAVEVHQSSASSSDLRLDLKLRANLMPGLIKSLGHTASRFAAVQMLGEMGPRASAAIPAILPLSKDNDFPRQFAVTSLIHIDPTDDRVLDALAAALNDKFSIVRRAVVQELATVCLERSISDARFVNLWLVALKDRDEEVAHRAAQALIPYDLSVEQKASVKKRLGELIQSNHAAVSSLGLLALTNDVLGSDDDLKNRLDRWFSDHPQVPAGITSDFHWLVRRLSVGEAIRINCGGPEFQSDDGTVWGHDRFYESGRQMRSSNLELEIDGTEDDPLYRRQRWTSGVGGKIAYRIPVPRGQYEVVLHFAELTNSKVATVFGVRIEGNGVLSKYNPQDVGYAVADKKSFLVEINDSMLDIEFTNSVGIPQVSAIEILKATDR